MELMKFLSIFCLVCYIILIIIWMPNLIYVLLMGGIFAVFAQSCLYLSNRDYGMLGYALIVILILLGLTALAWYVPDIGTLLLGGLTIFAWIMVIVGWITDPFLWT